MTWEATASLLRFTEAVRWFRERVPVTDQQFRSDVENARKQAFWIAGVTQASAIRDVFKSLGKALDNGVPFSEWKKEIGPTLQQAWTGRLGTGEQAARTETILRNWAQSSYNNARWDQMATPAVRRIRPFLLFDGIADSRQSPICKACNGTLLPADHPWWDAHRPPMHHRCRSGIRSLRTEQALARGITKTPTDIGPQEGFGEGKPAQIKRGKFPKAIRPPAPPKPIPAAPKTRAPKPQTPRPLRKGRPLGALVEGVHVKALKVAKGVPAAHVKEILSALSLQDLRILQRRPLQQLILKPEVRARKALLAGSYSRGDAVLSLTTARPASSYGQTFNAGRSWSISSTRPTAIEAAQATLIHELGHHVHLSLGNVADSIVRRAAAQAATTITQYARTNPAEYFAESFAAYRYQPDWLKSHDPNGYAMVQDVLALHEQP